MVHGEMLNPDEHPWLTETEPQLLMRLVAEKGGEARFVGGCVRDALLGQPLGDRDMATTLPPEVMMDLLKEAGIKVVPIGLEHGTVMAVVAGRSYEITTLRRDVETDGRHAKVAFTDDWESDAQRRDFTINALYVDAAGKLYDYVGGLKDLEEKRLRFIGDPRERIAEDVLRILRYFRFRAMMGYEGNEDAETLAACREASPYIPQLSVERVWRECQKMLSAPNPVDSWALMVETEVLDSFLPEAVGIDRLQKLIEAEKKYGYGPSSLRRLVAVGGLISAARLSLSKRDAHEVYQMVVEESSFEPALTDEQILRQEIYKRGAASVRDILLLSAAEDKDVQAAFGVLKSWTSPVFPLRGEDLVQQGIKEGPAIGALLRTIEEWWADADFKPSRADCLKEVAARK